MAHDTSLLVARAIGRLTPPQSTARAALVAQLTEYVLAQRLQDVVDLERLRGLITGTLTQPNVQRVVERHVRAGWRRHARAIAGSDARVGMLVPDAARPRVHAIAGKLRLPPARWAKGAVDRALVRRFLAPVWTQVLVSFATRLPIPGIGGAGGKRDGSGKTGALARSLQGGAEKLLGRGRSMMGGLGAGVERRLLDAARGFSDTAAEVFQDALRERVASEEGRALLAQITASVVDRVLEARFADLQVDAESMPLDDVFELAPEVVAYAAASPFVQEIVARELAAHFALEGERSLHELLDEAGIADETRAALRECGDRLAGRFFASASFATWLRGLLDD